MGASSTSIPCILFLILSLNVSLIITQVIEIGDDFLDKRNDHVMSWMPRRNNIVYFQRPNEVLMAIRRKLTTASPRIMTSTTTEASQSKNQILKKKNQMKKPTLQSLKDEGFLIEDLDQRPIDGCPYGRDPNRKGCLKKPSEDDIDNRMKVKSPSSQQNQGKDKGKMRPRPF